ncbi:deoxyribose-phosphate aldolase [Mesorhizobium sp. BR1-1-16]|uniref:deoxyribose-phosphate aldolase n=1 Tax=Mesorhizobium sp. BR1-1-16 TaxID=2876653 RepID=UPI00336AA5BB
MNVAGPLRLAPFAGRPHPDNPGTAFSLDPVEAVRVNLSASERRVASLGGRRTVKKDWQAAWLVRAIECIDLTTLAGDDTEGRVQRLAAKAMRPLRPDIQATLGLSGRRVTTGAVCVYHRFVRAAVEALEGSGIPVAAVSTGFPAGLSPLSTRLAEIEASVADGAREIDIVITREHVLRGDWRALYDEIRACKAACGPAHMKTILGTGDLQTLRNVARASWVAMMAGSDFIKTSTGKEAVNATLPVTLTMLRAIRDYRALTGHLVGYKPAGGISTAKDALTYLSLVKEELGGDWLQPNLFRFGASSLLADIERQLEHHVTGGYAAFSHHGMA